MKTVLKLFFFAALVVFCASASAQNIKLAHINTNELLVAMPEMKTAEEELIKYQQELVNHLETMNVEYNNLTQAYLKEEKNLTDIARTSKMEELQDKEQRIMRFREEADTKMREKQSELMQPIMDKARTAIEEVAKADGYTYVFDVGARGTSVIYASPSSSDIMDKVKTKLGIK